MFILRLLPNCSDYFSSALSFEIGNIVFFCSIVLADRYDRFVRLSIYVYISIYKEILYLEFPYEF